MELELAGKAALVTGSSRGIGRAIARALLSEGCRVALNARNRSDLLAAARDLQCSDVFAGDMASPTDARRVIEEATEALGCLDILICNVGSGRSVTPGMETADEWQRVFAANLWSTTNAVEAARDALAKSRGVVICISSICGLEVVPGAPVTYSTAKAALHSYVRGMARPLGAQGVRINAIAPGNIVFDGSIWQERLANDEFGVQQMLSRDVALGRLGTAEEVALLAVYLASPRSAFATGGIWRLDGGQARA